jgi:hypothetical protein
MRGKAENCSTDYLTLQHTNVMIMMMMINDDGQKVEARVATTTPLQVRT